jgi:hypothetical protein
VCHRAKSAVTAQPCCCTRWVRPWRSPAWPVSAWARPLHSRKEDRRGRQRERVHVQRIGVGRLNSGWQTRLPDRIKPTPRYDAKTIASDDFLRRGDHDIPSAPHLCTGGPAACRSPFERQAPALAAGAAHGRPSPSRRSRGLRICRRTDGGHASSPARLRGRPVRKRCPCRNGRRQGRRRHPPRDRALA